MWWFFAQITRGVAVVVDWTLSLSKFTLKNTWEVLNTQFQLFTAEEDIQSFLLEAKGFLKQIKLTAAVGVILPRFHPPFIQRKWVYCFLRIYHGFQEIMNYFGLFFLLASTKHTHLQHVKKSLGPRLDQVRQLLQSCMKFSGGSKVGRFLEHQLSRRNRWSAGCRADPSKTARLANFVKAPGKFAPIFLGNVVKRLLYLAACFRLSRVEPKHVIGRKVLLVGWSANFCTVSTVSCWESGIYTLYVPLKIM